MGAPNSSKYASWVLKLVKRGLTDQQIADRLGITRQGVYSLRIRRGIPANTPSNAQRIKLLKAGIKRRQSNFGKHSFGAKPKWNAITQAVYEQWGWNTTPARAEILEAIELGLTSRNAIAVFLGEKSKTVGALVSQLKRAGHIISTDGQHRVLQLSPELIEHREYWLRNHHKED